MAQNIGSRFDEDIAFGTARHWIMIHGISMTLAFMVIIPVAVIVGRYGKRYWEDQWLKIHICVIGLGVFLAGLGVISLALHKQRKKLHAASEYDRGLHPTLGVTTIALLFIQIILGLVLRQWRNLNNGMIHGRLGRMVTGMGCYTAFLGIKTAHKAGILDLSSVAVLELGLLSWIVIICLVLIYVERQVARAHHAVLPATRHFDKNDILSDGRIKNLEILEKAQSRDAKVLNTNRALDREYHRNHQRPSSLSPNLAKLDPSNDVIKIKKSKNLLNSVRLNWKSNLSTSNETLQSNPSLMSPREMDRPNPSIRVSQSFDTGLDQSSGVPDKSPRTSELRRSKSKKDIIKRSLGLIVGQSNSPLSSTKNSDTG